MLQYQGKLFDDYVNVAAAVYTGAQHIKTIGEGDQIGLTAIADLVTSTGTTLTVAIEHSMDGRNWVPKATTPEILNVPLTVNGTTPAYGGEAWPTSPSLEYVRFRLQLTASLGLPAAYLQLFVAVRDHAGKVDCSCSGMSGTPPKPRVNNELAVLAAKAPGDAIALLREELAAGGSYHPDHIAAAIKRLPGEHRAALHAHNERVQGLSAEARKEVLRAIIDEIL